MKAKQPRFTNGVIGNEIIGDPPRDTRGSPKTKSFGYQVLGFGSGGSTPDPIGVEYLIVGGGGSGGNNRFHGGGGGAGGFRTNVGETLVYNSGIVYTVTVGEGGTTPVPGGDGTNNPGSLSSVADDQGNDPIASAGGGRGGLDTIPGSQQTPGQNGGGGDGGSGGGTSINTTLAGLGNVPSTDPSQGNDGNKHNSPYRNGGGGGAGQAGIYPGGVGGAGTANSITGSAVTYAGGGGGGQYPSGGGGAGGAGGGGAGSSGNGTPGTNGLGGGGGGSERAGSGGGGNGGDGVVFLRMLTSDYSGTTSGSPTVTTDGGDTILKYLADGTYTS